MSIVNTELSREKKKKYIYIYIYKILYDRNKISTENWVFGREVRGSVRGFILTFILSNLFLFCPNLTVRLRDLW